MNHKLKLNWPVSVAVTTQPDTVKPFNLAALNIGDFSCKIILAPFLWQIQTAQFHH